MIDLVEFQAVVGRKTRFGKKPHPTDPWHYTRAMLATYTIPTDLEEVKRLFAAVGAKDECAAAMWVAINMDDVP